MKKNQDIFTTKLDELQLKLDNLTTDLTHIELYTLVASCNNLVELYGQLQQLLPNEGLVVGVAGELPSAITVTNRTDAITAVHIGDQIIKNNQNHFVYIAAQNTGYYYPSYNQENNSLEYVYQPGSPIDNSIVEIPVEAPSGTVVNDYNIFAEMTSTSYTFNKTDWEPSIRFYYRHTNTDSFEPVFVQYIRRVVDSQYVVIIPRAIEGLWIKVK